MARALASPQAGPAPRRAWARPAAIGAGVLSAVLLGVAVHQGVAANAAYRDADAMVLPGGALQPPYTGADHQRALAEGDAARRNAWIAGTSALVSAAGAVACWWLGGEPASAAAP